MILLLSFLLIFSFFVYHFYYKRVGLTPGPRPLPLIGNLLSLMLSEPGEDLYIKWGREFGGLYTIWFGELPVVLVTDYKLMVELFQKDPEVCAGRIYCAQETSEFWKGINHPKGGVVVNEGEEWREMRRFTLTTLRQFGLGSNVMEERILLEVDGLIRKIQSNLECGVESHDITLHVQTAIASVIFSVLFGTRFTADNVEYLNGLFNASAEYMRRVVHPINLVQQKNFRFYRKLPVFSAYFQGAADEFKRVLEFLEEEIQKHKNTWKKMTRTEKEDPQTDFVYSYFKERELRKDSSTYFDHVNLKLLMSDLWLGGQDTVSATAAWSIVFMIRWPEHQKQAQAEIAYVVGPGQMIRLTDRNRLPFVCAFINETQRLANIVPTNLIHRTTRKTEVNGHQLKPGTGIVPQISALLYDETVFPDSKTFDPTRFLDSNGRLRRVPEFLPFGLGRRQCVGEGMAKTELFLIIANLLNRFTFSSSASGPPSLDRRFGLTVQPTPYTCRIEKRKV